MIDPITRFLGRTAGQHGPVVLMYHAVTPGGGVPGWPWAVSMEHLKAQLNYLATGGWATPTISELLSEPGRWPGHTAAITFDDGYADNLAACEELKKRGMRATWFVVSGSIGQTPRWDASGPRRDRLLNASELREMQSAGMEIGSHTVNHVRLTTLGEAQRTNELICSRTDIEDALGTEVRSFAYPYGAWDAACAKAVRDADYRSACTTRTGWALRDGDPYTIRRLTMFNTDTASTLARKLSLGCNDVTWKAVSSQLLLRTAARKWKMSP